MNLYIHFYSIVVFNIFSAVISRWFLIPACLMSCLFNFSADDMVLSMLILDSWDPGKLAMVTFSVL